MRNNVYYFGCFLGQSFKPVEVNDNSESSFKVAEEPVKSKSHQNAHENATPSSKGESAAVEMATPPEMHTTGKTKMHPSSTVHRPSQKTVEVNKNAPRPYHIQHHVINATAPGLPIRLHVHPDLPLPISGTHKQAAVLSRQHANDLNSSKASTIHNHRPFEWGPFSKCTVTCGSGVRKRYRRCSAEECTAPGIETQVVPCTSTCSGMI